MKDISNQKFDYLTTHSTLARSQASTLINIINWVNGTHYEQRIAA